MTVRLAVRLTPRSGRDCVGEWARDEKEQLHLKVRVAAPPVEGAANAAMVAMIAKGLKVSRGAVRILSGDQSRLKILEIDGVAQADLDRAFGQPY